MSINEVLKKINSIRNNYIRKKTNFGFKLAFANFIFDVNGSLFRNQKLQNKIYDVKKSEIDKCIEKYCRITLDKTKWVQPIELDCEKKLPIWTFWFQEIESAPEIVQFCLKRMKNVAKTEDCILHILTWKSIKQYIDIPNYIETKMNNGEIEMALFSDFVRISLLEKYGGIWIDATCYITSLPQKIREFRFFSCKSDKNTYYLVSREQWANYCLGTNQQHNILYQFLRKTLMYYWEKEHTDVDYLLTDYLIRYAYNNLCEVKVDIEALSNNNSKRGVLMGKLNEAYDLSFWKNMTEDTWLFKLTYKHKLKCYTRKGEETFYNKIITETL